MVTGPLVDAGVVGRRAAGISHLVANANVERQLGAGWSVDAGLSYFGERWANTANSFTAPAVTTLGLGARGRFVLAGRPAELRLLGSNLTGEKGIPRRALRPPHAGRAANSPGRPDRHLGATD